MQEPSKNRRTIRSTSSFEASGANVDVIGILRRVSCHLEDQVEVT